jgi:hypothetical protein
MKRFGLYVSLSAVVGATVAVTVQGLLDSMKTSTIALDAKLMQWIQTIAERDLEIKDKIDHFLGHSNPEGLMINEQHTLATTTQEEHEKVIKDQVDALAKSIESMKDAMMQHTDFVGDNTKELVSISRDMDNILRSARALLADKTKYIERNIKRLSETLNVQTKKLKKVSSDLEKKVSQMKTDEDDAEFDPEALGV